MLKADILSLNVRLENECQAWQKKKKKVDEVALKLGVFLWYVQREFPTSVFIVVWFPKKFVVLGI